MNLRISTAPHIHHPVTTQRLMIYVLLALLPTLKASGAKIRIEVEL